MDNHGVAVGWGFGGLIAALAYGWPTNCVGQGPFGPQSVEYDEGRESFGSIACTNVFGWPRVTISELEMAAAGVVFAGLLGGLYEVSAWWRRSQAGPATGAG